MKREIATVQKGDITLVEYSDPTFVYEDNFFVKCTCVGFYATKKQLKDLHSVLNYYLSMEEYEEININIGESDETLRSQ